MTRRAAWTTGANVAGVLRRLADFVEKEDGECRASIAVDVDEFIDALASNDLFGTEAQLDPRRGPR
jgi:hypothetical protein